ncbi:sulfotransferase [Erythrobacter sp.]|jgi:hypothetical protein|uniref:sulfotransferase n=1 Tax=Erythrobacter sp. TaxID=1042 RepID=UPI002EADA4DA|nr:sulfotransferase [Erythrobacter sp.]
MPAPLRDHPLARGRLAERANDWLGTAWEKGWLKRPVLEADTLWSIAARPFGARAQDAEIGGRRPEDVADFRERLERLCVAIETEANLNALGRAMAHGQLVRVIRNRLALGALWTDRPQLLATPLARPIIVIGHMRSGTTRIHKLLAADPAHTFTRYCDAYHPVPQSFGANRAKSAIDLAMLGALNPWLQTIHPMAAGDVEEELAWISAALHHSIYESQWHIPSYSAFSEARCAQAIYREYARLLRTDAAHRGNGDRPRVMKVPAFSEDLSTLLGQFPDTRVVISERCREAVLRSAVSLVANQMGMQSDTSDLDRITAQWRHKLDLREARIEQALATWDGPVARLQFDALNADWEREIRRIYGEFGLRLSDQALTAMRALMATSESGQHHAHSEQLKRFAAQG